MMEKLNMGNIWDAVWDGTQLFLNNSEHDIGVDNRDELQQRLNDIKLLPLLSVGIFFLRILYEKFIAVPLCKLWKLSDGRERKQASHNEILATFFDKQTKHPSNEQLEGLSKQTNMSLSSIRTWFRRKRNWNRPTEQKKFCEASWRFLFYLFLFTYGMFTLWQSPWFWDNKLCWENIGRQVLDFRSYVYYMLECSFYLSLLISIMTDIKRKDFLEQIIHHAATLFLIVFSYMITFVRIGTLVMAVHDISDIFLELAKCFHYTKQRTIADAGFVVFSVVFLVSRLVIYPFWIIHTSAVKSLDALPLCFVYFFFNFLLLILLGLHMFWGSIIVKMALKMVAKGEVEKDDRSDTEELSDDEDIDDNHIDQKKTK